MEALRTPDDRFVNLPGWPYAPQYTTIASGVSGDSTTLRIAHIDEGPRDSAATVLCMHGEPSWSYLYRKMIPVFVAAGHRVVAPDLIGFGRSDKPVERSDYTYERHVAWMSDWLTSNDLSRLTLVCQDWGGLIGLRLVAAFPERFDRVVVANTFLPVGDRPPSDAFMAWRNYSQTVPEFKVGRIVEGGCARRPLAPEVVAAYDAPFPDDRFKAGARVFPTLVPISTDDPSSKANIAAWQVLERFDKPVLTAFSDADPVTKGGDRGFQQRVPGTSGQPHTTIVNAGHFLQEDAGEELAHVVNDFVARTPAN
ncbi:MAG: alpha/beta fold hydrolase [Actinobacteria bacterium]|jgi:haloalkane dehalogenase|nr:alpha/beta fold hydrolase [Actinomycetota bacterium]NCW91261.1 alpha/beta fold hydrolase [Acidimicrobiia bacterium]NCX31295.1 alpha/beta fold hydrolase [Actinomycetota bacterium]NCX78641.1 alpha/beta fold hydrolase [Actinomycetota bacterium]NCZ66938.1 alpha/beta fold hydrolase [Acidimicrobiia bacterium]